MKIAYTFEGINQKVGGVSRYFYEICSRLKIRCNLTFIIHYSNNIYFNKDLIKKRVFLYDLMFKGKWRIEKSLQLIYTKFILKRQVFDLIHHTGEFPQLFQYNLVQTPVVITIHDMTPEIFDVKNNNRIRNRKICIVNSSAIICVSENTKKDLFRYYPEIDRDKVFTIYHGSPEIKNLHKRCDRLKYLLYVGSRYEYKNFTFFIKAIANFLLNEHLFLYCTGVDFTAAEKKLIIEIGIKEHVVHVGFVDDIELAELYFNAVCFVFPSLYEGFGIPILEAFQYECPVCLSNTSCFPEIGQNAVVYFEPYNAESIIDAIRYSIKERVNLIKAGKKRINDFSWEKATYETEKVYNWVLNKQNEFKNNIKAK